MLLAVFFAYKECMRRSHALELFGVQMPTSSNVAACHIAACHIQHVFVGKLVNNQASSIPSHQQQQQHQQRMILGEHTAASLLDVESDMPLTFALDTQMLQLPSTQAPISEGGWRKRLMEVAFGS